MVFPPNRIFPHDVIPISGDAVGKVMDFTSISKSLESGGGGVADLALPAENLLAWWYAGNGATKPEEITVANPLLPPDGQAVTAWADLGVSSYDLTKAGAGTATWRKSVAAANGRGGIELNNAYFSRNIAGGILANLTTYNLHIAFFSTTTALAALYGEGRSTGGGVPVVIGWLNNPAGDIQLFHRSDASVVATLGGNFTAGAMHIFTGRRIASNSWSILLDGVEVATDTDAPGTTTIDRLAIGALVRDTVTAICSDTTICCVAIYSDDSYASVFALMAEHYGVTMPPFLGGEIAYASSIGI